MSKALLVSATAVATLWPAEAFAEKWDMPMAYAASNYHSETGAEFAQCVTDGTSGALEIAVHPSGSLFSGDQIKRAVQTGQTLPVTQVRWNVWWHSGLKIASPPLEKLWQAAHIDGDGAISRLGIMAGCGSRGE